MNLTDQLDSGMNTELSISNEAQQFLLTACKWAKFLSIVGFVSLGFLVLAAIGITFAGSSLPGDPFEGMGFFIGFMYLLFAGFYFFPILYFYRFSVMVKQGIETTSTDLITSGFENLKSSIKFIGVLTAVVLAFYLFALLLGLIFGIGGSF
ncbi:hypothetical protein [Aureispira anguillae]|uniref:DUF5362 domain-containing protein n=1 Tax=Aureispira anguillae TaxID=2864201 RepID=A0A916DVE8_9BACT|nr:hypothetical protein [Aureispira anguillae]BDS15069.1 hypothetical protein AsAng_0058510 [Aureispira anguillae]